MSRVFHDTHGRHMFTVVELGITEPGLSILSQTYIHLLGQHFLPGPQGGEKFQLATGSKV